MTPELPGISDLAPLSKDVAFWAGLLRERVPEAAGFRGAAQDVPEHVRRRAGDLEAAVYRDPGWTGRR